MEAELAERASRSLADRLTSLDPPWAHLAVLPTGSIAFAMPSLAPGVIVRTLDGRRAPTKTRLMAELARALEFPPHFGANWDALEDCLTDLSWLPGTGYLLVLTRADRLLHRQPRALAALVEILGVVGGAWATEGTGHPDRRPTPFHTLFIVSRPHLAPRRVWRLPRLWL